MKKVLALVLDFFGMTTLPEKDGQFHLTEDQKKQLNEAVGDMKFADQFLEQANLDKMNEMSLEQKNVATQLKEILASEGVQTSSEKEDGAGESENELKLTTEETITQLRLLLDQKNAELEALRDSPDGDGAAVIPLQRKDLDMKHSKSHLFGSGKTYDAFDGRQWNMNALHMANGEKDKVKATDWSDSANIDLINRDLADYSRKELDRVADVMQDYRGVPDFWPRINNVIDEIAYTSVLNGEITQGSAKNWLPKNNTKFVVQKGKVYDVKIDIEYSGFELKKIERSWMNKYNKEGSSAYKMSFVRFLVGGIMKKAREEDSQALIKGVYIPDELRTESQSFLFRESGLEKLILDNRGKTYGAFDMGKPTTSNIVDYVKGMCEKLPEEKRSMPRLVYYCSNSWYRAYQEKRKILDGLMPTYKPGEMTVENFPNIKLYPLDFLDGQDLHFITPDDNIEILNYLPKEKALIEFEKSKRNIFALGDYKQGIHVGAFGAQWVENTVDGFNNQIFWSNDVEVLLDVKVPIAANATTFSAQYHNVFKTGVNTAATAITAITDAVVGKFYYIHGNTGTASSIANGANFDLASTIDLEDNQMIKLYYNGTKFVEIERVDTTVPTQLELADGATTADGSLATHFVTVANTGATAFTNITNAVKDTVYRIEGGSSDNATTIAQSGNFSRISAAITLNDGVWIDVLYNGSQFVELQRSA